MKTNNKILLSSALALAVVGIGDAEAKGKNKEKCYGVAKAGKNDCGGKGAGHSCSGEATKDAGLYDFLALPKGICAKLAGGSLKAGGDEEKKEEDK